MAVVSRSATLQPRVSSKSQRYAFSFDGRNCRARITFACCSMRLVQHGNMATYTASLDTTATFLHCAFSCRSPSLRPSIALSHFRHTNYRTQTHTVHNKNAADHTVMMVI